VQQATNAILHADEMMQRKAYALIGLNRDEVQLTTDATDHIYALVQLGAAVARNCTPTIIHHLAAAKSIGTSGSEIKMTIKLAKMVLARAGEFADEAISDALEGKVD